jgi:hypothetical protein
VIKKVSSESVDLKPIHLFKPQLKTHSFTNELQSSEGKDLSKSDFNQISTKLFQRLIDSTELALKNESVSESKINPSRIPPNRNDLAKGKDYLGIDKDVTAFAKIIASNNFSPPLAIALFGKWGSGKSFFMNKLQERIELLSSSNTVLYNSGIVHIQFNAWSYMDANLWASIVSRIFDALNQYINDESVVSKEHRVDVENALNEKLKVLGEERMLYEKQKETFENDISTLAKSKKEAQKIINDKIKLIRTESLQAVLDDVDQRFDVKNLISDQELSSKDKKAIERIEQLIPGSYLKDPVRAVQEAKSLNTFLKSFFDVDRLAWNLLTLLLIFVIVIGVPFALDEIEAFDLEQFQLIPQIIITAIGTLIPIWKRIESNYRKLQPAINSLWTIKKQYDKEKESAIASFNQNIELIKIEIEHKKMEIGVFDEHIMSIQSEISELDFKLKNFISTHSLYSFIEKRAEGDVYKKHLGIISTIRSDFEALSEMFNQSKDEQKNEKFREYFKRPLQRIILYIDDLDRCSEDRVIEVLEAVNLIMAFPLFVVVVGVDHRWVNNSLIKQYHSQFKGSDDNSGYQTIDAGGYLEKIFQIPFHLNQPEEDSVRNMIKELSKPKSQRVGELAERVKTTFDSIGVNSNDSEVESKDVGLDSRHIGLNERKKDFNELKLDDHNEHEMLELSERELELIQDMAGLIGTNPRAIKRFVNIYHIVRAHEGLTLSSEKEQQYLILMFLLVLFIGPHKPVREYLDNIDQSKSNIPILMKEIFKVDLNVHESKKIDLSEEPLKTNFLGLKSNMSQIRYYINKNENLKPILDTPLKEFKSQNEFIKRFTFSYSA